MPKLETNKEERQIEIGSNRNQELCANLPRDQLCFESALIKLKTIELKPSAFLLSALFSAAIDLCPRFLCRQSLF